MDQAPTRDIKAVIDCFDDIAQDIDNLLDKTWLKPAIINHILYESPYHRDFITEVVNIIFVKDNLK